MFTFLFKAEAEDVESLPSTSGECSGQQYNLRRRLGEDNTPIPVKRKKKAKPSANSSKCKIILLKTCNCHWSVPFYTKALIQNINFITKLRLLHYSKKTFNSLQQDLLETISYKTINRTW